MYLRGLRLRGFKSFADPVELTFEPGVAVIVGPNGSGKSNVAEALQWAMASLPPSELRMESAADVLFAGAERRGPVAVCEVELVLSNEDDRLAAPGPDRPEVSVMRRLTRAGDSSYLLNRQQVRRLDVQETLADAGLGRELHAIVSQGRVESILLSRPADRRGFIEEAAGLGKYKRRRHRARGKLQRVELNLERARDLDRELTARLRPLALQASAAERATELRRRIGEARVELLGSQIASARHRRHELDRRLDVEGASTAALDSAIGEAAGERAAAELELSGLAARQETASAAFYALEGALDRLRQRADGLVERADALAADEQRARLDGERLHGQALAFGEAAETAAREAEDHARELDALEAGEDEERLESLVVRARALLDESLAARRAFAELEGGQARAATELETARERHEALARQVARLVESARTGEGELAEAAATLVRAEAAAVAARRREVTAGESLGVARAALEVAREEERARRAGRAAEAERAASARSRVEAARAAVRRGDGLTPALRGLREAGVRLLLDELAIDPGYEVAVSGALEWRAAEAIATTAHDALELLGHDGLAGAALACLDRLGPRPVPEIGRPLREVIRVSGGLPGSLLDGVSLVEDAGELLGATRGIVVALDGRGFDADRGVVFRVGDGGAVALVVRRDAAAAAVEEASLLERVQTADATLVEASANLGSLVAAEGSAAAEAVDAGRLAEEAERARREAVRASDRAARAAERAAEAEETARVDAARLAERIVELHRELTDLAAAAAVASERASTSTLEHERADAERADAQAQVAELRGRRAAVSERLARARSDHDRHAAARDAAASASLAAADRAGSLGTMAGRLPRAAVAIADAGERAIRWLAPAREARDSLEIRARELAEALRAAAGRETTLQRQAREAQGRTTAIEVERATTEERLGELVRRRRGIAEGLGADVVDRVEPRPDDEVVELEATIERLERRLLQIGPVNPLAEEEYAEARTRAEETAEQIRDLEGSLRELRRLIRELTATISGRFDEAFAEVESGFREVVQMLFPGGRGRLRLVDPAQRALPGAEGDGEPPSADEDAGADADDVEPGVELEISPAGKEISQLSLLSGGEKALAAIAFLFAIMLARPCPFYVLDEVDAALDDVNVERFLRVLDRLRGQAQFIVITHQKRTMEAADTLYGVTMAGDGVSQVVSRRLPRVDA